jgi:uncharacterized protein
MRHRAGLGLLIIFSLWGVSVQGVEQSPKGPIVHVTTPQGKTILAEVADTTEKRAKGLMFRDSLSKDQGMLFTFEVPQAWTFWMKNTKIPLDIIWMDRNKRIVHVERNVPGCARKDDGCPQYQPNENALYVLEIAAGQSEALQLQRGVKLKFDLSVSGSEALGHSRSVPAR